MWVGLSPSLPIVIDPSYATHCPHSLRNNTQAYCVQRLSVIAMRLLDTETGQFMESQPEASETVYAVLSHTWDKEGEQTYEELRKIQRRYGPGSQAQQSRPGIGPEGGASSSSDSKRDQHGPSSPSPPLQLPIDPPFLMTSLSTASLGRLTESEVETLLRAFGEAYGLTCRTTVPASSDHSTPETEHQATKSPESIWEDPALSPKIRDACAVARKNGYRYIWIDSCCIDKSSSSELSEAINSMYKWYNLADVCYAYLADVPPGDDHQAEGSHFRESRWFTRGWTLQELIAPINVEFLSQDWSAIGSKYALDNLVESITKISRRALLHLEPLNRFSIAQRLSWAARRETTREEDRAYSLLGLFDINMPTLYGEGDRAFERLQEQIMQRIPDQSLFAWGSVYLLDSQQLQNHTSIRNAITLEACSYGGQSVSARSPPYFRRDSGNIRHIQLPASLHHVLGYTSTPYGICTQFQMIPLTPELLSRMFPSSEVELQIPDDSDRWFLTILGCEHTERPGHLLGRVCCIPPSKSEVEFVYSGFVRFSSSAEYADLFPLSPETIKHSRPHVQLKTMYIPRPDLTTQFPSARFKPYNTIKLVLSTETRDALHSHGYSANLCDPDPDHPTSHWLTLSKDEHTITFKFEHTLEDGGRRFTINAEVMMSGSHVQQLVDSALDPDQADPHIVSWSDACLWESRLGPQMVALRAAEAQTCTVDLSLDFVGTGLYFVHIDILSDALPTPPNISSALPASEVE